jgi:hypothetical protein
MTKPTEIFVTVQVAQALGRLSLAQRGQFNRLVEAIRMAPQAGHVYARDGQDRLLRIISAADVHLVYTITYRVARDRIFLVDLVVAEWSPGHVDMP